MTVRRRFFPAQRVQQVPGRTVELEVQVLPEAEAAAAAAAAGGCTCDVEGVALLPDMVPYRWADPEEVLPTADGGLTTGPVQRPRFEGWRCTGGYVEIPSEWSEGGPVQCRAIVAGATTCAVEWSWTLNVPELPAGPYDPESIFWDGVEVEVQAGVLLIKVLKGFMYEPDNAPWWAELRVEATCGGEHVGTIVLRPGINLYPAESLPLPE